MFFTSVLDPWSSPPRNIRLSLYRWLNKSVVVLLMMALRMFGFDNSWTSPGSLSKPWLLCIVTIRVLYRWLIILFLIVRWSMLNFIIIILDIWYMITLSHFLISKLMIKLLISSPSPFWKLSFLSFIHCLGFQKLQSGGGVDIIPPHEPLECCVDGGVLEPNYFMAHHIKGVLEPKFLLAHHISSSSGDNKLIGQLV